MDSDAIKRVVKSWAIRIGAENALKRLINAGISVSVAQKLVGGRYVSALSYDRVMLIKSVLAKDGVSFPDEMAS